MFYETSRARIPFYVFEDLEKVPGFVHAFTSRQTDASIKDAVDCSKVAEAKPQLMEILEVRPERLVLLRQVHSSRVVEQDCAGQSAGGREREEADGVILTAPGCFAVVRTADCLPIVAVIPDRKMVCCLHAGWRGTRDHIAYRGLSRLLRLSAATPSEAVVALGPCIRRCCYEVGEEVREEFGRRGHRLDEVFEGQRLDLVQANLADLRALGIERVLDSGMCTACCPELFYSYRRSRDRCRMWALAGFRN